jgi:outer membrane protein assembly factor BamB
LQPPPSGRVANTPKAFATTDGAVYTSAVLGNVLYIGGAFTHVITTAGVSVPASHLAALDASTGNPISGWRADTDTQFGAVRALAFSPDNTRLYVGGDFTTITSANGAFTRRHLAAVDPATGTVVTGWAPSTDNSVLALAASSSSVYAGGDFLHANNQNVAKIAAFSAATGALLPGWNVSVDNNPPYNPPAPSSPSNTDGRIQALTLSADGSKLYLGGYINHVWHLGQSFDRPGAAAVSTVDGAVDPDFRPVFLSGPEHKGMDPFQILVGRPGHLYVAIGGLRNVLYDVNPITGATRWKDTASNDFQTIALSNRYLYAGGHIHKNVTDAAGTHTAVEAIRVDPDTGLMDTTWTPGLGPVVNNPADPSYFGVWTMSATPAGLYVGGAFLQAGGVPRRYLALYPAV